jgi:hypothetical protein
VKTHDTLVLASRQAELATRLDPRWQPQTTEPVLAGGNIRYELSARIHAIDCGGLGMIQQLVATLGLRETIDERLQLFKRHLPYRESDHVLNMTYNLMTGGTCLEDLELRRQDLNYLDALGARRIPDPTTEGDFLRRFAAADVVALMEAINEARLRVWQPRSRRKKQVALLDLDGTIAETSGECKQGMDIGYNGKWGYGPLVVSLANSQEVLYVVNRPASRPSHEGAPEWVDRAVAWTQRAGFAKARLRGDTDFSLTAHFDRWTESGTEFVFGVDAREDLVEMARALPAEAWRPLDRGSRGPAVRERPVNVKVQVVQARGFEHLRLDNEYVTETWYQPRRCRRPYRLVIVAKHIAVERGQEKLFDEVRFHFYVTNIPRREMSAAEVVRENNARCHQENLIEQLKNGVQAMRMPVGNFVANWCYMVIGALAWNLKAWLGLVLPSGPTATAILRMEYRRFVRELVALPCQVFRSGRQLVYRLLTTTPWVRVVLESSCWLQRVRYG